MRAPLSGPPDAEAADERSWSLVLGGSVARLGIGVVTGVLIVRALEPTGYAAYAVGSAIMLMAGLFVDFGITGSAVARIARSTADGANAPDTPAALARSFTAARVGLAVAATTVIVAAAPALGGGRPGTTRTVLLLAGAMYIANTATSIVSTLHQATSRFGTQTAVLTAHALLALGIAGALSLLGRLTVETALLGVGALSATIAAVGGARTLAPAVRPAATRSPVGFVRDARDGIRRYMGEGRWLALHTLGEAILARADLLILLAWVDPRTVGLYGVAVSVASRVDLVVYWSLFNTLLPRAATLTPADIGPFLRRSARRNAGVAIAIVAGGLAAPWLVPLVYGAAFAPAADTIRWLLAVALIDVFLAPVTLLAFPLRRVRWLALSAGVRAGVFLVVAFVGIPELGVAGAVAARLTARVAGAAVVLPLTWREARRANRRAAATDRR